MTSNMNFYGDDVKAIVDKAKSINNEAKYNKLLDSINSENPNCAGGKIKSLKETLSKNTNNQ